MKTLIESNHKSQLKALQNNLYSSLAPNIRLILEKPFKCDKCGKRFKAHRYVLEHKREMHSY